MPTISVIIPVYNVEAYLEGCLQSVLSQANVDIEVIAVNDGATDGSAAILEVFSKQYTNLKVITQHNQGLSAARNAGVLAAAGTYTVFIDSDDTMLPDTLAGMLEMMDDTVDLVETPLFTLTDDIIQPASYCTSAAISDADLDANPKLRFQIAVYAWCKLYRTSLIRSVFFPVGLVHEDVYFTACLLPRIRKIRKSTKGGFVYLQRSNSITGVFGSNMYDMIAIHERIYAYYESKQWMSTYHYIIEKYFVRSLCVAILAKKMAHIQQELQGTRKEKYEEIKAMQRSYYPSYLQNPYITIKEKLLVCYMMMSYQNVVHIWKKEERKRGS